MQIAYVPPIELLVYTGRSQMQFMLAFTQSERNNSNGPITEYTLHYDRMCIEPEQYVIMSPSVDVATTFKIASDAYPQEVIIPFHEHNKLETLAQVEQFDAVRKHYVQNDLWIEPWRRPRNFGFVPQGEAMDDYMASVDYVFQNHKWITAIHIPSSMYQSTKDRYARLKLTEAINAKYDDWFDIQYHLLSPDNPEELRLVPSYVRGVTTSAPFMFAKYGLCLDGDSVIKGEELNGRYMVTPSTDFSVEAIDHNLEVVRTWTS
jgi:hypothetical protein